MNKGDYIKSYFIRFDATGVPEIDDILVAIARAAKAYHSTEGWSWGEPEGSDNPSYLDLIQQAADHAAKVLT